MILHPILRYLLLSSLGLLAGCANFIDHREAAFVRAEKGKFTGDQLRVGGFELVIFHRGLAGAKSVVVYIEGDGRVARTRIRLSDDPTPRHPVGLELALADTSAAVLYVARPCQYLTEKQLARCNSRYWSLARYAEEVVAATNQAIDWAVDATNESETKLGLVGYSGGGAVATLVAARRDDVIWLVTVAGNLDHEKWTELHQLTPLVDSLNPVDFVEALAPIPQLHLIGDRDENISLAVAESYRGAFDDNSRITLKVVSEFTHHCCWTKVWPEPVCQFSPAAETLCIGI